MSAQDFLVELGTEELPPKALNTLADAFLAGIEKGLLAAGLTFSAKQVYGAPRRLAVLITDLATQQPDRSVNLDGPPRQAAFDAEGNPTQAALGFAKKCGVDLSEIDQSGPKLRYSQSIAGKATASLLPTIVEDSLNDLPIPKRMRWGARKEEFVRPTQWLVMLFGDQVIDCTILAQTSGRESRGHRFHHPESVRITSPASYLSDLRAAYVLADFNERRQIITKRIEELATQHEGTAIVPPSLLDEVTSLVEWPVPLVCSFEERFLEVPQEALITTMQDNQKYFCLLDAEGKLLPRFITVANIESKDPQQIVLGNEKVVRPRLTDAEFFFKQDKKQKLETFNQRLQNVVFQAQLGSVFDKAERVAKLAAFIAPRIGGDAQRAARGRAPRGAERDGYPHRDRRFRHGLFVACLPEALPDRLPQGRSLVRGGRAARRRQHRDHPGDHRDGAQPGPESDRRGRGDAGAARFPARARLRRGAGVLPGNAARRSRNDGAAPARALAGGGEQRDSVQDREIKNRDKIAPPPPFDSPPGRGGE